MTNQFSWPKIRSRALQTQTLKSYSSSDSSYWVSPDLQPFQLLRPSSFFNLRKRLFEWQERPSPCPQPWIGVRLEGKWKRILEEFHPMLEPAHRWMLFLLCKRKLFAWTERHKHPAPFPLGYCPVDTGCTSTINWPVPSFQCTWLLQLSEADLDFWWALSQRLQSNQCRRVLFS
jgi:hypothetical protein